ncbi:MULTISPECIES: hypothetical protein [Chryseobacterium]|uniref:C-type lectin domain-containing protein n=1 Tax=Chryseobacterium nepalense TaxID=1854498 RepID=A0ABY4KBE4_9FLAO|nr:MULTISPECIES: hypothetical protein [Chryseobacterium]MEA1849116.1 hypothetical protein [Chryseobacterium sp. MHB01]UPQ77580.1 hypothetical protein M0D58_08595 [Chryseobacterium nepalense]
MKNIITLAASLFSLTIFAQVGINNNTPKATLDITAQTTNGSKPEGLLIPRLTGDQIKAGDAQYGTAQAGTIVFATSAASPTTTKTSKITEAGFYYFTGSVWERISSTASTVSYTTVVDPNILGYVPSTTATASVDAPATLAVGATTATRRSIGTYGGHTYAAYSTSGAVTWYQAYNAAKNMGGYLATFASDAEWQYVETNLLTPFAIFNTNGTWIGMAKFSWFAGAAMTPDPEIKWITGEQPGHDYSAGGTTAVRKSNWFPGVQPDNLSNTEGFVQCVAKNNNYTKTYNSYTTTHGWNDSPANYFDVAFTGGFIVEFQQ